MVNPQLADYIRRYIKSGYDVNTIRATLLKYGYNPKDVEDAIHFVYKAPHPPAKVELHLSKTTWLAIIAIFLGIVFAGLVVYLLVSPPSAKAPATLLDITVQPLTDSVQPGNMFEFNVELTSMGAAHRYDVTLIHEIVDTQNNLITSAEETLAIETRFSGKSSINIPEATLPGTYSIKTTADYDGKTAAARRTFYVYKPSETPTCTDGIQNQDEEGIDCGGPCSPCPSCYDDIQNQDEEGIDCGGPCSPCLECPESCDDEDPCTFDFCDETTDYYCDTQPLIPCCGNDFCEFGENYEICPEDCEKPDITKSPEEIIEEAKQSAKTTPDKAGQLCDSLSEQKDADDCFLEVAGTSSQIIFCDYVKSDARRDNCYMDFALEGNYEGCDQIKNTYLKNSCKSLASFRQAQP